MGRMGTLSAHRRAPRLLLYNNLILPDSEPRFVRRHKRAGSRRICLHVSDTDNSRRMEMCSSHLTIPIITLDAVGLMEQKHT
jgi:hypothetical protein